MTSIELLEHIAGKLLVNLHVPVPDKLLVSKGKVRVRYFNPSEVP